jgi:hypothetical protein
MDRGLFQKTAKFDLALMQSRSFIIPIQPTSLHNLVQTSKTKLRLNSFSTFVSNRQVTRRLAYAQTNKDEFKVTFPS